MISPYRQGPCWLTLVLFLTAAASAPASEAGKLLPPDTDLILTVNLRRLRDDHRNNKAVRQYFEDWRQSARKGEVGFDPADLDRITFAFKAGTAAPLAVIVEGSVRRDEVQGVLRRLAQDNHCTCRVAKLGGLELWQVADGGRDRLNVLPLHARALAITGSKSEMEDLLARSKGRKKAGPSADLQALLDRHQQEHFAVMASPLDLVLKEMAAVLPEEAARRWNVQSELGLSALRLAAEQLAAQARKYSPDDVPHVAFGLSLGKDELHLRLRLETRGPEVARDLGKVIDAGKFWAGLTLRALNDDSAGQLAALLAEARTLVQDATLTIELPVSYQYLQNIARQAGVASRFGGELAAGSPASTPGPAMLEAFKLQFTSVPLWGPLRPAPEGALAVEEVRDVAYYTGPQADRLRHRLDLYVPKGKKDFPVVVLVHGGAWTLGDNRCCGLYCSVGHFLASQGIGAVLPNYRLSPRVQHPEHVKDVARAVAWARSHVAEYGGDPQKLFLMGHSAGGHLVTLLGTDASYLEAEGLKTADLKGVIGVSGVYRVAPGKVSIALGGLGSKVIGMDQVLPLRGDGSFYLNAFFPGLPGAVDIYRPAFGDDPKARAQASPLTHVRPGLPPFLLLRASKDWPTLSEQAEEFSAALRKHDVEVQLLTIDRRNHNSVLFSAISPSDPAARAILEFIRGK